MQFPVMTYGMIGFHQVDSINGTSKFASEDIINRMPENVITNILDRLPIQEAVRTSILSRNWRSNWTLLTQLIFDDKFLGYLQSKNHVHVFYKRNLSKLLLQLKGSITKFVLYIPAKGKKEYNAMYADIAENISHWILFLSTKGMKEFAVVNMCDTRLKLPSHLFSCLKLKHLELRNCRLHPVLGFHCYFHLVTVGNCKYGEFITRWPLLENLNINYKTPQGEVKLCEIAKLVNLKMLSLRLCKLGDTVITSSDILQLMGSLPKLENLDLNFEKCKILAKPDASKMLSASLHRLKTLALKRLDFKNHMVVECACDLINGFPNLQTFKMTPAISVDLSRRPPGFSKVLRSLKGNLQLKNVVFERFKGSEIEVHFIKSLLAYSSLLATTTKYVLRLPKSR